MKELMIRKSSIVEMKSLLEITNHDQLSRTLNNINFYLSIFSAKRTDKIFENKEKTTYNCRGPTHVIDTVWIGCQTKSYSIIIDMKKLFN